ncbi:heme lyase CcmF/NrfE family subunit [Brevundimonas sp. 2R-24]|uniref:Heme lyase CcmF/NrfE family subunit n=1 Tax=Peiella sedimenti TaxID=3061083 RepID=A0ABT8SHV5_9CAUL|nr:heme lyase CcmF/NrfE family subunit [Caulobacteraceae bacterium XZ-24]
MIAEFGAFLLALAFAATLLQVGLSTAARWRGSDALGGAAQGAATAAAVLLALAFAMLIQAFVASDFSVENVAANSHTDKPLFYKVTAAWGSHEGSMLLWCLTGALFSAAMAWTRGPEKTFRASALAVHGGLNALFLAFLAFTSSPFARLAEPPVEGASLNPLLQDPALAIHPPMLYLGYVGFSAVFALAVAALIEGRRAGEWARWMRPWVLASWALLTLGITLGSFWAYYELGWGGWWFWDPVENASFLPWLAGAALLHSVIVTQRRGALAAWTVFLAILSFSLSMLGAFLVRSGVLTSVHAFAVDPSRGVLLLAILGVSAGVAFSLFAFRAKLLVREDANFAPVSREGALVLNNLFLTVSVGVVLIGTLYPLMLEAVTGEAVSVGPPYYNLTFAPLLGLGLTALPVGAMLAWRRGRIAPALKELKWAGLAALGALVWAAAVLGLGEIGAWLGATLAVWLMAGALWEPWSRAARGADRAGRWRRLKATPVAVWAMTLAHLGLGVFLLGAVVETTAKAQTSDILMPGGRTQVAGVELTLDSVGVREGPNYLAEQAVITARRDGRIVCRVEPERRLFPHNGQMTTEVGLCFQGLDDLYVVLGERRDDGAGRGWTVRAHWNPLARLIFLGPLLMALGGILAIAAWFRRRG